MGRSKVKLMGAQLFVVGQSFNLFVPLATFQYNYHLNSGQR